MLSNTEGFETKTVSFDSADNSWSYLKPTFPSGKNLSNSIQSKSDHVLMVVDLFSRIVIIGTAYFLVLRADFPIKLVASCVMGIVAVTLIATLFHECLHENLPIPNSFQPWIARLSIAPLGLSYSWWRIKHVREHHQSVGNPDLDPDIQFFQSVRVKSVQPWRPVYRVQFITLFLLMPLAAFNMLRPWEIRETKRKSSKSPNTVFLILEKYGGLTIFWFPIFVCCGTIRALYVFISFEIVAGVHGGIVAQLQHNTELSNRISRDKLRPGYDTQFYSTSDTRSKYGIWWWLTGGTSRHVIHHLYPKLSYVQLPRATAVVKDACNAEWPEHSDVFAGIHSLWRMMRKLSVNTPTN